MIVSAAALALALAAPSTAAVAVEPVDPAAGAAVRVERRLLRTEGHLFLSLGPAYLARGDYFASPGLVLSATWYLREGGGLELRAAPLFSRLDAAGREVSAETGLVPDAQRPVALVTAGWRQSLGYGKVLPFPGGGVVHFDLQGAAAAGLLRTDRSTAPALAVGPGLLARLGARGVAQLDVQLTLSFEERRYASLSPGILASLTFGGWL